MRNLLFVSTCPLPVDRGSNLHAYYFLKALALNFNVYCIFFIEPHRELPSAQDLNAFNIDIKDYDFCFFRRPPEHSKYALIISKFATFPSSYINAATNGHGRKLIKDYIQKYAIDIVHFENFWYGRYAFGLPQSLKKVMVYHDLHHSIFKQQMAFEKKLVRKAFLGLDCLKYYVFERLLDNHLDCKVFLNPCEMSYLPGPSVHIPHIANPDITFRKPRRTDTCNILFLGAYSHPPNRISLEYTLNHILPKLVERTNNFIFHIVGPGTERLEACVGQFTHKHLVKIHGFKENIDEAFKGMDIAMFPILYGGGIKTKVIDTMAAGVPIVTTPQGIIGLISLPENCVGVGSTIDEILDEVTLLMNSYSLRLERSQIARAYIEGQHSFTAFSEKIADAYAHI
jgi:glycosyltransferase involved in cell wall biosynthesis